MDTCMCIAASLCCPLETITVLSIVIYKVKRLKKKKKNSHLRLCFQGTYSQTINLFKVSLVCFHESPQEASSTSTSQSVTATSRSVHHLSVSCSGVPTTARKLLEQTPLWSLLKALILRIAVSITRMLFLDISLNAIPQDATADLTSMLVGRRASTLLSRCWILSGCRPHNSSAYAPSFRRSGF